MTKPNPKLRFTRRGLSDEEYIYTSILVDTQTRCWVWNRPLRKDGYSGAIKNGRYQSGHVLAYRTFRGEVPAGLCLDHLCRNPACVNPDHLEAVTMRENTLRGIGPTSVNAKKTHCYRGHAFTPENTAVRKGGRFCRKCDVIRSAAHKLRKKGMVA